MAWYGAFQSLSLAACLCSQVQYPGVPKVPIEQLLPSARSRHAALLSRVQRTTSLTIAAMTRSQGAAGVSGIRSGSVSSTKTAPGGYIRGSLSGHSMEPSRHSVALPSMGRGGRLARLTASARVLRIQVSCQAPAFAM